MADFMMTYGLSETASDYLGQQTLAVEQQVEATHTTVQRVMSELEGAMAEQYKLEHDKWTAKVAEMGQLLGHGNQILVENTSNYLTTDRQEQMRWEGTAGR